MGYSSNFFECDHSLRKLRFFQRVGFELNIAFAVSIFFHSILVVAFIHWMGSQKEDLTQYVIHTSSPMRVSIDAPVSSQPVKFEEKRALVHEGKVVDNTSKVNQEPIAPEPTSKVEAIQPINFPAPQAMWSFGGSHVQALQSAYQAQHNAEIVHQLSNQASLPCQQKLEVPCESTQIEKKLD